MPYGVHFKKAVINNYSIKVSWSLKVQQCSFQINYKILISTNNPGSYQSIIRWKQLLSMFPELHFNGTLRIMKGYLSLSRPGLETPPIKFRGRSNRRNRSEKSSWRKFQEPGVVSQRSTKSRSQLHEKCLVSPNRLHDKKREGIG